jgi:hypothetical protein
MSALEDLVAHDERLAHVQRRARALGNDLAEQQRKIGELKQRKVGAHADENESLASKLRRQIAEAEGKIVDLEERQAGAQLAASRADAERTKWITDHYRDLISELEPDAKRAAKAIDERADELIVALKLWENVKSTVAALGHVAGQNQPLPNLGWDELSRALRRRPQPTKVPLPQWSATGVSIAPEHDPDPVVREAARNEIREKTR